MLFATVRQRKIYVKAPQTVVKDGVNVDVLKLEMDDEWAEMTSIICVFSNGSVKKEVMHTFGQPITVPWECLESTGVLMLGITGYVGTQKVMTTMNADNGWEIVQNSETTGDEQFEATPTLTQQLLEAATSANNAAEAANTAKQDILDAVSNGEFDGAPGKDGADGLPGADGYSPSAKVTQTAIGAEITITDKDGTTTATVTNGKDGADGVGIESVVQTTTSTEDGGTNVVTVTKTDGSSSTFTVKNGSKGSDGSGGTNDHSKLSNRDAADQHPMKAITGLEAALTNIPPTDAFIVTLTKDEAGTYSVDKTFAEIQAALQSNRTVYLYDQGSSMFLPLVLRTPEGGVIFGYVSISSTDVYSIFVVVHNDNHVEIQQKILSKLPNPNALTFTGAVAGSYDGSAPLSVEIPSGGGGGGGSSQWKIIRDLTITENTDRVDINTDDAGAAFSLHEIQVFAYTMSYEDTAESFVFLMNGYWGAGDPYIYSGFKSPKSSDNYYAYNHFIAIMQDGIANVFQPWKPYIINSNQGGDLFSIGDKYQAIGSVSFVGKFIAGCRFVLFGRVSS